MNRQFAKILLVEDNEDDYEATLRSLKKSHVVNPVKWCKNGKDALEFLKKATSEPRDEETLPDLVLLDLNMPGIDGRHVLEHMKEDKVLRHIPVIVLTTSTDEQDIEDCYDLGVNTYIQKPVSLEGLTKAIQTFTDYWFDVAILPRDAK